MTVTKTINNTILVKLNKTKNSTKNNNTDNLKKSLLKQFTAPFTNVLIDFNEIDEINRETIDALIAGQRLSKMNVRKSKRREACCGIDTEGKEVNKFTKGVNGQRMSIMVKAREKKLRCTVKMILQKKKE